MRSGRRLDCLAIPDMIVPPVLDITGVDEHGSRAYPDAAGEEPEALALRVKADAEEHITAGILNLIMQAMTKLSTPVNQDTLAKN